MPDGWRFIATRALTGTVLDWDVPLSLSSNPQRELSGPGQMKGLIEPEWARMKGSDGQPLLREWDTAVFAEVDGHIRWGGLLTKSTYNNAQWTVNFSGYSAYPHGMPYEGYYISGQLIKPKDPNAGRDKNHDGYIDFSKPKRKVPPAPKPYGGPRKDAYDAVRHLWWHLQSKSYGDLGVQVDQHNLGHLLGLSDGSDPYELAWWDTPDCGTSIDNLARTVPFDWVETHAWKDKTSNEIVHRIRLGTPRLGRKRTDLRFVDGENLIAIATPEGMGDEYANEALILGRGEGKKMLRQHVTRRDGRLRRVSVIADKTLKSASAMRSKGSREIAGRTQALQIPVIEVINHPNARLGAWQVGDDIRVQATVPWVGDIDVWHRIVADEISPTGSTVLNLKRSDSFHY